MPRRREVPKRETAPDSKHGDQMLGRFINVSDFVQIRLEIPTARAGQLASHCSFGNPGAPGASVSLHV